MKNYSEIIIRPLLTEKSNLLMESNNKYVFQVSLKANKIEKSIEEIMEKTETYGFYEISFKTHINDVFLKRMKENYNLYHLGLLRIKKFNFIVQIKKPFLAYLKNPLIMILLI